MSSNKRSQEGDVTVSSAKKSRMFQFDMVVVVGGEEFQESSYFLRNVSGYFEAAFQSDTKEAQEMWFEFPDKDPEGWRMVMGLLKPFSKTEIHKGNINRLLEWFGVLCYQEGLDECDRIISEDLMLPLDPIGQQPANKFNNAMDFFETSLQYNLKLTQQECLLEIESYIQGHPETLGIKHIKQLPSIMEVANESCQDVILAFLHENIPDNISNHDILAWAYGCSSESWAFASLVHTTMQLKRAQKQINSFVHDVSQFQGDPCVSELIAEIRRAPDCKDLFGNDSS